MARVAHRGVSLTEYGIIFGLVVLAAVAGLALLGNNLNLSFQNQATVAANSSTYALLDPVADSAAPTLQGGGELNGRLGGSGTTTSGGSLANSPFMNVTTSFSIGSVTTSAEGTLQAADVIEQLANLNQMPDGSSMENVDNWGEISNLLSDLANRGRDIANIENTSLTRSEAYGETATNDQAESFNEFLSDELGGEKTGAFGEKYDSVMDAINNAIYSAQSGGDTQAASNLEEIKLMVDHLSGVISYSALEFAQGVQYSSGSPLGWGILSSGVDAVETGEFRLVGTQYQAGEVAEIPDTTQTAANSLG